MFSPQSPLHSDIEALVICNGDPPGSAFLRRLARRSALIVAADGGANTARRAGIVPDLIIGDLDSVTPATRRRFSRTRIIRVRRQDNTDFEKVLDHLRRRGVGSCVAAGVAGRRLDFTLGNLAVALRYLPRLRITFAGEGWWAVPLERDNVVAAHIGSTVSFIPWGACAGVTLRGVEYPLTGASLAQGMIAVSNIVRRNPFRVTVRRGKLMMVVLEGRRRR
jgi:thiamine pyrophosphokinase